MYLYLLIEFQSTDDPYMALRMMVYVGLLYQDLIKAKAIKPGDPLPPVLPIVLYNGGNTWKAKTPSVRIDVADLIPPVPGLVERFKPHMEYLLIAENSYTNSALKELNNLVAAAFRLEQQSNPDNLRQIIANLKHWLADRPELRKIFAHWIRGSLMRREEYRIVLPEVNDLEELNVALADRVEQWAKDYRAEGMQQGLQKGMQQGEALALQRLLSKRFGEIPAGVAEQISRASAEQIEGWLDQVLEATSLESLFGNIH